MRRIGLFLVFCALVALGVTTGCATYRFEGTMAAAPPALARDEIPEFAYDRANPIAPVIDGKTKDHGKYIERGLKWRSRDMEKMKEKKAKAYFYSPKDEGKTTPALVLLPPTGGPYDIVKPYAKYFAERGFTVIALRRRESFFKADRPLEYSATQIRQAVIDARRAIDYLDTLPYVDKNKTAVMGISLGGIIGALTMESDGRVEAAGFLVTGAHMADIMAESSFSRVYNLREAVMERENIGPDQLRAAIEPAFGPVDPARYADRIDPARLVMVNGALDDIIPRKIVLKTRETYGGPTVYFMPLTHYTSIGFPSYANRKIYEHFKKVLDL